MSEHTAPITVARTYSPKAMCAIPDTPLAHAAAGLDACVHCGFCLQACPTYVNLEDENDSPRGRLVLMRRMLEGDIPLDDPDAGQHLDRCLGCRACETACPSGVPYGDLLEATRATMAPIRGIPWIARVVLAVFKHSTLLHVGLRLARIFRATGLPRLLANTLPERLAFPMAMLASTAPKQLRPADDTARVALASTANPLQKGSESVTCLTGCVMHGIFGHVNAATERVLAHNGYAVLETRGQHCCGALHAHAGDLHGARELAKRNITAFEAHPSAAIAVNSAGCGAMIKQYAHLLHDDDAWHARAQSVAARTKDVSELLAATGPRMGGPLALRVTHDPPCHQMHAQRVVQPPRAVLAAIPDLNVISLEDADQCCGSAGIYNLVEPDTSNAVLAPKLARIAETGADFVATGNPGCMMQIGAGLILSGSRTRVVHPIELLDASYHTIR